MKRGGGGVNGHFPVMAGDVPVKLVVVLKKLGGIQNGVLDVDCPGGVDCARNKNLELEIAIGGVFFKLEFRATVIGDAIYGDEKGIIGAVRSRILHGNAAINTLVLPGEGETDLLGDPR